MVDNNNLQQVAQVRKNIANNLDNLANTLESTDIDGLISAIADIKKKSKNLQEGVFRIFVLGDVKRGKSTVINALIGEDLLPRDVNACTGVLTVLRYGAEKKVTVYYQDDTPPEEIDFTTFKEDYTITVDEAKNLDSADSLAFPNVKYAVVEYPLDLLESGIEIIDSPGLNDTEARNELSLGYVYNCQAILFVLRAVQPFTLEESRYLDNYIKDRGLNVFFLINGWDEIKNELIDPEDSEELAATEAKSYQYFQNKLASYIPSETPYEDRVFEISAINALRSRIKNNDLSGTGFDKFTTTLTNFLTQERATAEFTLVKTLAEQTYNQVHEIIERRIPLLEHTKTNLKAKIADIEPEFVQLANLRDLLTQEITTKRDLKAQAIANSFEDYVLQLGDTFEVDFFRYEPELYTFDFLIPNKREKYYQAFKKAFEAYITDKITTWEKSATQELEQAFTDVLAITEKYAQTYEEITESINTKLISRKIIYLNRDKTNKVQSQWKNWTIGCLALATGNVAGIALASAGFNWKTVLINWFSVFGISRFLAIFTGMMLGPYGVLVVGLGVGSVQAGVARKNFAEYITKEFSQYLPKIAQEQKLVIKDAVVECFDNYQQELVKRIDNDLQSRKAELDSLIKQQSMSNQERDEEVSRLQDLDAQVLAIYQQIEAAISG